MALLKKSKEQDEELEELEEENEPLKKKPTKKTPSRSRQKTKKAKPKPWGKKERFIVLFLFIITAGGSAVLGLSAREWKLPGLPRIVFKLPRIPFLTSETVVLEGEDISEEFRQKEQIIVEEFNILTNDASGIYGLYVIDLNSGYSFAVNESEEFEAASLIKLPLMAAMYMEEESGNINLSKKYVLKNADKIGGSGSLYSKPEGYEITYENLVRAMGKESDNTAFNVVKKLLGEEKIQLAMNRIGMNGTSVATNMTSLRDIAFFFEGLWNGNFVNDNDKEILMDNMTDTLYESWITEGVPDGVRVVHKYGREVHVVNDAGIVFADNSPYVIVVMTKGVIEREADKLIPLISEAVYRGRN